MPNQKGAAPILLILIILMVGAVGYFVLKGGTITPTVTTPYDKVFQSKPQPVTVKPIKTEASNSAVISEKGGILALKDQQQDFTLTLPEGALLSPEEISLQVLKTIDQLPGGSRFIAGAQFNPDGLGFVKSSTLTIKLPKGTATENLVAFAYEEGGQNFYFHPFSVEDDVVEIPLDGFSGGGVIEIAGLIPIINPGTPEQTAKQLVADVLKRAGGKMLKEIKKGKEGRFDPKLLEEARGILNAWYQNGVKPDLKVAETDDGRVDGAIKQMLSWRSYVELLGLEEHFQKEFQQSLDSAARAIKHAVYQADKRCLNKQDPRQVSALLRWLKIAQLLGIDGKEGLRSEDIKKKVTNCAVFELSMESTITGPSIGGKISASLKGTVRLSDDLTSLTGSGTVNESPFTYASACLSGAASYGFTVLDTKLNINFNLKSAPKVNLLIDFAGEGAVTSFSCPTWSTTDYPPVWITDWFSGLHEDEAENEAAKIYFIRDWQYVGSEGIYAKKIYQRSMGGLSENTNFFLKHTPRQ